MRYQTLEFDELDLHIRTLRDRQQHEPDQDSDAYVANWALFGVLWDSGLALAGMMAKYEVGERRVLEVGCGIALSSLVLQARGLDVLATDYHPRADEFLQHNAQLNHLSPIPFAQLDWDELGDKDQQGIGLFDLIIASDVLYERNHPVALANFITHHARPTCEVILLDPGRRNCGRYDRRMLEHGFESSPVARSEFPSDAPTSLRGLRHTRPRREP